MWGLPTLLHLATLATLRSDLLLLLLLMLMLMLVLMSQPCGATMPIKGLTAHTTYSLAAIGSTSVRPTWCNGQAMVLTTVFTEGLDRWLSAKMAPLQRLHRREASRFTSQARRRAAQAATA